MDMNNLSLYSYWRSSSAWRVRIALYLKNIPFEYKAVHLLNNGGEQKNSDYKKLNPMGQVPCLSDGKNHLSQSLPIIQLLDKTIPEPLLFPKDLYKTAKVTELCEQINSGIQPLQNLSLLQKLQKDYDLSDQQKLDWGHHWIKKGFTALEKQIKENRSKFTQSPVHDNQRTDKNVDQKPSFCFEEQLSAADLFLIPQIYNAGRFGLDMTMFPILENINNNCNTLEAFIAAHPDNQPDRI